MKLIFTILTVFLCSLQMYGQEHNFSKDGVSLSWDLDWEITVQDSLDGDGFYLALEKWGLNESALFAVTWLYSNVPEEIILDILQEELRKSYEGISGVSFSEIYDSKFAGIISKAVDFEFTELDVKFTGTFFTFRKHGKSFSVLKQEAVEDSDKNAPGFSMIEGNFSIN